MGGRGASSGVSISGKPYGTEFKTLFKSEEIKFVIPNGANNAKDPLETMTKGRIYATVNGEGEINAINIYGDDGKRIRSINLLHSHNEITGEHTHIGYFHKEGGTRGLTDEEKKLVARVKRIWYNRHSK